MLQIISWCILSSIRMELRMWSVLMSTIRMTLPSLHFQSEDFTAFSSRNEIAQ